MTPSRIIPAPWLAETPQRSTRSITARHYHGQHPTEVDAPQPRGERADHVAQDRRLAEDRGGAQPAHGGDGMMIRGVAVIAVLALSLLVAPLAAYAQQAAKVARIGYLSTNLAVTPH